MSTQELAPYYSREYGPYVPPKKLAGFFQTLKYKSDLRLLKKYRGTAGGTLFEVGAGRGEFLKEAQGDGFQVRGLEPSAAAVQTARDVYGIRLEKGFAEDLHFDAACDCVLARHVLEHLNDPVQAVNKIYEKGLKPGGVLMVKLPRLDSWEARLSGRFWSGLDLPRHRVHFSREAAIQMLARAGFQDIKAYPEMIPVDILRDMRAYAEDGKPGIRNYLAKILVSLPFPVQLMFSAAAGILLFPFGPGRMIIFARK